VDKNTIVSTNTTGGTGDVFSNNGMTNGYSAGANMSWEIDLFGANRRAIEASEARYAASQQNWNDAKVSLAAQVADVYVSIRQCQNLLLTYQEENKSRLATQNITELRVNAGFSPRTDGNQASGSLYQNSSTLAQQRGVCEKYANQLVALSGVSHTQLEAKLSESFGYIPLPKEVSINALPAEIINQRPDVAAAERNLAAANADLSVAIANRYPQVSLTGSISANGGSLYAGQPTSWSLGPSISLPFTDGGYLRAQESLSSAKYEEALATYRSKIINAVQEVEDSLVRINAANQRVVAAEKAEQNYAAYFEGYNQKYNTGWANLLDLETVRVTLIGSKEKLASAKLEQVEAWIALYKAVGGEWNKTVSQ
jgi:NodT family efflux transporter outer membrane factor (OMF) lipoprotein